MNNFPNVLPALPELFVLAMACVILVVDLFLTERRRALSLYAMIAFQRDSSQATEAAMKYFVLGAIASGMLLYGMSMLYGATGTLEIAKVRAAVGGLDPNDTVLIFGLV